MFCKTISGSLKGSVNFDFIDHGTSQLYHIYYLIVINTCTRHLALYSYINYNIILVRLYNYVIYVTSYSMDYMKCYFLQDGNAPIHLASRYGHVQVVEKLISLGANVNVVDKVSVDY